MHKKRWNSISTNVLKKIKYERIEKDKTLSCKMLVLTIYKRTNLANTRHTTIWWPLDFKLDHYHFLLKDRPPFLLTSVPARLADSNDLESGPHFNSLRSENKVASSTVISLSFILLHETTRSLSSCFQERTTDSNPSVVSNEHPSSERDLIVLRLN